MTVTITLDEKVLEKVLLKHKESKQLSEAIHVVHYRELANSLTHIAKHSPNYTLERTGNIKVLLETSKLKIGAYTHGQYLFKLPSLTDPTMIAEHLCHCPDQRTFQIADRYHHEKCVTKTYAQACR